MISFRIPVFMFLVAFAGALAPAAVWAAPRHDNAAELTANIRREKNPVKKAKLELRLGELDVQQAASAYGHHQLDQGKQLLEMTVRAMRNAWLDLKGSGRDAARKSDGFMQLEISLREEVRTLTDLRERISYFQRLPIDQTIHQLSQLHGEVIVALFPGAVPPPASKTRNSQAQAKSPEGESKRP